MKTDNELFKNIQLGDMYEAAAAAEQGHTRQREVIRFNERRDANVRALYESLKDGTYRQHIHYYDMVKTSNNGKVRHIKRPAFATRVLQHLVLLKLVPLYEAKDPMLARNCKKGCGINTPDRERSVLKAMKHLYYDLRNLTYIVYLDQRSSYDHCTPYAYRRGARCLTRDREMIEFCEAVTFVDGKLPIGTPTSPFAHHLIMLRFDIWAKTIAPYGVRYADDIFLGCENKAQAAQVLWRIKQYWWYELGIRAKRSSRIQPLSVPMDICGYVLHRNPLREDGHNKGYARVRKSILRSAKDTKNNNSWVSYYSLLRVSDSWTNMRKIETKMKLRELTEKIRINRELDAPHVEIKDIEGKTLDIIDYTMRHDKNGEPNWIKCLLRIPQDDGTAIAREFHGNYQGIIQFISAAEKQYGKAALLPLEECCIINQCGYIFKDSTNQIKTF